MQRAFDGVQLSACGRWFGLFGLLAVNTRLGAGHHGTNRRLASASAFSATAFQSAARSDSSLAARLRQSGRFHGWRSCSIIAAMGCLRLGLLSRFRPPGLHRALLFALAPRQARFWRGTFLASCSSRSRRRWASSSSLAADQLGLATRLLRAAGQSSAASMIGSACSSSAGVAGEPSAG